MNSKLLLTFVVAFMLGAVGHFAATKYLPVTDDAKIDVAKHWRLVNKYHKLVNDPDNYESRPNGLISVSTSYDPEPHFVALAAANEIESVDAVLPNVPKNRKTNQHWMKFVSDRNDDIIYAVGNPEYVGYKITGTPPLHLKLWFRKSAKPLVQQLIEELEQLGTPSGG